VNRTRQSRFARVALTVLVALLVAYHLVLFGVRVVDGSVLDPAIAAEWIVGLSLLLALGRLHRAGLSLVKGRGALVLWLAVLVLHAVALVPGEGNVLEVRVDQKVLGIVPLGVAVGVAVSRLAGLSLRSSDRLCMQFSLAGLAPVWELPLISTDLLSALVPRAPPA
jgi:hypothetical protein